MKSSYELAMERLNKVSPTVKLSDVQKQRLAELDAQCKAKIADREILIKGQMHKALSSGEDETLDQLEKQLASDRRTIQAEFDEKKEKVRQGK
jgi:hypothetical protein